MDAGKYIGGGVGLIQSDDPSGENIFLRVDRRTHGLSVGEQGADGQTEGHPDEQKGRHPVKFLFRPFKQKESNRSCHEKEPEKIRYDEIFAERDQIIERDMDIGKRSPDGHMPLQPEKPGEINKNIEKNPGLTISVKKCFQRFH